MNRLIVLGVVLILGLYVGATTPWLGALLQGVSPVSTVSGPPAKADDGHGHRAEGEAKEGVITLTATQITAARIEVAPVSGGVLTQRINVAGAVIPAADRVGRVAAKVVGTVSALHKQLGDKVEKGEVVAELESREVAEAKSEYLAAGVNFELQRTLFERERSLYQKNITAEQQFLRARSAFSEAQLRADLARQKLVALGVPQSEFTSLTRESVALQKYDLRAPITGRIVERLVSLGAPVGGEGQIKEVYGVADLSKVWIEMAVSPKDLPNLSEGQTIEAASPGADDKSRGRIVFKSPLLSAETRTARVIAEIDNADGRWQPGAYVSAAIVAQEIAADLVVPKSALQTISGEQVVFVRTREGFEKREVAVGRSDGMIVEIVFGLDAGEDIAVRNSFILKAELGKAEASHAH